MKSLASLFNNRKLERLALVLITVVMALLFRKMFNALQRDFTEVNARMENGTMVNLNDITDTGSIKNLLKKGFYFEDPKDIQFIASTIKAAKDPSLTIDNTGELNKQRYFVNADEAFVNGG